MKPNEELETRPLETQTARVAFKSWPLATQRRFIEGLLREHAYACGVADEPFVVRGIFVPSYSSDLKEGQSHRTDKP